jgi:hypothetical protein
LAEMTFLAMMSFANMGNLVGRSPAVLGVQGRTKNGAAL